MRVCIKTTHTNIDTHTCTRAHKHTRMHTHAHTHVMQISPWLVDLDPDEERKMVDIALRK